MMTLSAAIAAELHAEVLHTPGVTYDSLAERSGVPSRTLKRHLTGDVAITLEVAEAVTDALGLSMEEVLARARLRQTRRTVTLATDEGQASPGGPAE